MACEQARYRLSLDLDAALPDAERDALSGHLATCSACRRAQAQLLVLRRALRFEVVGSPPDVVPGVLAAVEGQQDRRRRQRRTVSVAAVFVAAFLAGAAFVGLDVRRPSQVVAAALPAQVLRAQHAVSTLSARVAVVERGWHPAVPERRYAGTLRYAAPESLALVLRDETRYPPGEWLPNDVALVVAEGRSWQRGSAACPVAACLPGPRLLSAVDHREPFPADVAAPLDLVVPAGSFTGSEVPRLLDGRRIDGREAIGVASTVAQAQPLLDGLRAVGSWRRLHSGDAVELWLDAESLVPLAVTVRAASGSDRALWAGRHGYRDAPGDLLLELRLHDVVLDAALPTDAFPPAPSGAATRDGGFRQRPAADGGAPAPAWLPAGMRPHRSGTVTGGSGPAVSVRTWSDGRAWVKVESTTQWRGARLFGDPGDVVARTSLADGGTVYVGEGGTRVALHTRQRDVLVSGSVATPQLLRAAASLGLVGRPVPRGWAESATVGIDQARAALPGLLVAGDDSGFGSPAVRVTGRVVTLGYVGAGARGFTVTQMPGVVLAPPLGPDVQGVAVRGVAGRWSPAFGELAWVERGRIVSLRSRTLSLDELRTVAEGLQR